MTDHDARQALTRLLAATQPDEMDCDTFEALLAEQVEGGLEGRLAELFEHHRRVCPECEEERRMLIEALKGGPSPTGV